MTIQEVTNGVLALIALVVVCLFLALTATAIFRPKALPDVIALVKTIALALIGRSRSQETAHKPEPPDQDDQEPPTFPAQ